MGNSVGVPLPAELLSKMHIGKGDDVHIMVMPNGSIKITPFDPDFERKMELFERSSKKFRNAYKALAK